MRRCARNSAVHRIACAMAFHHKSCSSATGHLNSPAAVLIDKSAPPTTPQPGRAQFHDAGALQDFDGVTGGDGNDGAALGLAEKQRVKARDRKRRTNQFARQSGAGVSRAICWEMQLSASATARPPSLQSCALFTRPE